MSRGLLGALVSPRLCRRQVQLYALGLTVQNLPSEISGRPQAHMVFCKQHQKRARNTGNMGLRSADSSKTRRHGGVGGAGSDTPSSRANSGPDQYQHPLTAPPTARECARETPLQPPSHDATNNGPWQGLDSNRERVGDDRGHSENVVVITASDGRIACANCKRWFSSDRVGVHQSICKRVNPPSARDTSKRGRDKTARSKTAKFASSRIERHRRPSSRLVVGEKQAAAAAARARGARGRSAGGEKGSMKGRHAIDYERDRMVIQRRFV